jgi:hypothetical protein
MVDVALTLIVPAAVMIALAADLAALAMWIGSRWR